MTAPSTAPARHDRVFGLDAVRACAILMVLLAHSMPLLKPMEGTPLVGPLVTAALGIAKPFGLLGVELFFVLSGFLIGGILIRTFTTEARFGLAQVRTFWIRRWFRTLPNYYLVLAINVVIAAALGGADFEWSYLFFTQNLFGPHPDLFPEAWSLSVEEWFYLTLPVVLLALVQVPGKWPRQRLLLLAVLLYLVFFAVLRIIMAGHPLDPDQDIGLRKVVMLRLDVVMYGVFMAWFTHAHAARAKQWSRPLLWIGLVGAAITAVFNFMGYNPRFGFYDSSPAYRWLSWAFLFTWIPLFFCLLLPYTSSVVHIAHRRISAIVTHISKISYSLYLVHFSLVYFTLFKPWAAEVSPALCVPVFLAYWVVVILLSTALYTWWEVPMMRLRDRFK